MTLFPFFGPIDGRTFLLVGGGNVAARKLKALLPFTDRVLIVAEDSDAVEAVCREMEKTPGTDPDGPVWPVLLRRAFRDTDLEPADYVIAATDDREQNRSIAEHCHARKKPVNVVDDPEACTFVFPSLVKRGDLVVGISTSGKAPAFGRHVRETLEEQLPDHTEAIIDELYALTQQLKETVPEQSERAEQLHRRLHELLNEEH